MKKAREVAYAAGYAAGLAANAELMRRCEEALRCYCPTVTPDDFEYELFADIRRARGEQP